jgi:hypothetical protein
MTEQIGDLWWADVREQLGKIIQWGGSVVADAHYFKNISSLRACLALNVLVRSAHEKEEDEVIEGRIVCPENVKLLKFGYKETACSLARFPL